MRVLTFLLFCVSFQVQADVPLKGAVACQDQAICREKCDALETTGFCSVSRTVDEKRSGTEITLVTHCHDWESICLREDLLTERGTPNPAYNWKRTRVSDHCWLKDVSCDSTTRR